MQNVAIIGGTCLSKLPGIEIIEQQSVDTPYGKPSADLLCGILHGKRVYFLARHGNPHTIPPHKINYRANIWAIKEMGVQHIIAVAAVGGITKAMYPARIIIPDQVIDYTYGREHTFFAACDAPVTHIDFSNPYSETLRQQLITAAQSLQLDSYQSGVYGATQGPRLETAAEIRRMEIDGCDLVGMTGMPEAALARELQLDYANISVIANWAAGKSDGEITMQEIERNLDQGMGDVINLLSACLSK